MVDQVLSRRQMMMAIAGLGTVALAGRASAMTRDTISGGSELGTAYANRCSAQAADSAHAKLIGDLQSILMQRSGQKGEVMTQTAYCPICGCPVTVTRVVD